MFNIKPFARVEARNVQDWAQINNPPSDFDQAEIDARAEGNQGVAAYTGLGNGAFAWYVVDQDNGTRARYMEQELVALAPESTPE
jgi:hypothetical protein